MLTMGHRQAITPFKRTRPGTVWLTWIPLVPNASPTRFATAVFALWAAGCAVALAAGDSQATPFPRPATLVPAIGFWTRVYTEADSASGFIHDDRRLDIIYQVLFLNPDAPPAAQSKSIEKSLAEYRRALLALASGKRQGLTVVERQALQAWGADAAEETLRAAAERLRFQRGQADRFRQGLTRSKRWQNRIQQIFRARGLPPELAALPHVESSYHPAAQSKAGAAGLWQFMPATARRYLRVDDAVDERLDPYKSSEAAAHLLEHNHSVLQSWPLAITAYNHGLSGMRRAVHETGSNELERIVQTYDNPRFGFASRNFYTAFLAALAISQNPGRYFAQARQDQGEPITVVVPAYLPVDVVVEAFGVDKARLRELNPSLHHGVWNGTYFVPSGHALKLPSSISLARAERTLQQLAEHFGFSAQRPTRYYEVRLGDSLSEIAQAHDTTTRALLTMNQIRSANQIHAGQVLRVPLGATPEPLGVGAAALIAAGQVAAEVDGSAFAVDLPRMVAVATGQASSGDDAPTPEPVPAALPVNGCVESGLVGPGPARFDESETSLAASPTQPQPDLAADPVDYGVAADGSIEIQIDETLGHFAEWLELRSEGLRKLNQLRNGQPLIVGRRFNLDLSKVTPERFEERRVAYHQSRQLAYFARHHIAGVREHAITQGDNLWVLAVQQYDIPLWLLRQYNPDIDVDTVLPLGSVVYVPKVSELPDRQDCLRAQTVNSSMGGA